MKSHTVCSLPALISDHPTQRECEGALETMRDGKHGGRRKVLPYDALNDSIRLQVTAGRCLIHDQYLAVAQHRAREHDQLAGPGREVLAGLANFLVEAIASAREPIKLDPSEHTRELTSH